MTVEPYENHWVLRVTYFVLAGYGIGFVMAGVAGLLMLTIVGFPLGLFLLHRMPAYISLRPEDELQTRPLLYLLRGQQRPLWGRLAYFVLVGWWLSAFWMGLAYLLVFSLVGLPLTYWMFEQVDRVATLYQS